VSLVISAALDGENAAMRNHQLTDRVRELRGRGCTPKQIVRILGLPLATAAHVIRAGDGGASG